MPALNIYELPTQPSLGELIGTSLGQGFQQGAKQYSDMLAERQKYELGQQRKQAEDRQKTIQSASTYIPKYLKEHYPDLHSKPEALSAIEALYKQALLTNPDMLPDEARDSAVKAYRDKAFGPDGADSGGQPSASGTGRSFGGEAGVLGNLLSGLYDKLNNSPFSRPKEYEGKSLLESFGQFNKEQVQSGKEYGQLAYKEPGAFAGSLGLGAAESTGVPLGADLTELALRNQGLITQDTPPNLVREYVQKARGAIQANKTPEEQRKLGKLETLGSVIPLSVLLRGFSKLGGLFSESPKPPPGVPPEMNMALKTASIAPEAAAQGGTVQPINPENLAGRIAPEGSAFPPEAKATELRIDRLSPEERIFKPKEAEKALQKELSQYPEYVEEISADANDRAGRADKVLGPRALATRAERIKIAESSLPTASESYARSAGRVRALEAQIAENPQQIAELRPLLNAARRDLEDAEYYLRQVINNAKTGESRVGLNEMRQAAQKKTVDISENVGNNKEVDLKLMDYNPEIINKAKSLGRRKLQPVLKESDYFTQVHETYGNVYKERLNQLNKAIDDLKEAKGLSALSQKMQLGKEKAVLQKLIDHIEAESMIHRHKMGLREIQQRKLASNRFKKLKPAERTAPKISNVAKERMNYQVRFKEAITPEAKAAVLEQAATDLSQASGQPKEGIIGALKSVEDAANKTNEAVKVGASTKQAAVKIAHNIVRDWKELKEAFPKGILAVLKTRMGRDVAIGISVPVFESILKEADIPLSGSVFVSAAIGARGGAGYRMITTALIKALFNKIKKENYKEAINTGNTSKVSELNKSLPAKLRKEAIQENNVK